MPSLQSMMSSNGMLDQVKDAFAQSGVDSLVQIPFNLIDDMPDNEYYFPYDEQLIETVMNEIKENGFNDPLKVVLKKDGRYLLISGHQRRIAATRLGMTTAPCIIQRNLDEKQQRDLWRAENLLHRKITPLGYARLIKSYEDDFNRFKLPGKKKDYAASKCGISPSQVLRYKAILAMPEDIQERCQDLDFPYTSLYNAAKFTDEQKEMLSDALKVRDQKKKDIVLRKAELDEIIEKVIKDTDKKEFEDQVNPADYEPVTGEKSEEELSFYDKSYNEYKERVARKIEENESLQKGGIIDSVLDNAAIMINAAISTDIYLTGNEVQIRNSIRMMRENLSRIEKKIEKTRKG